MSMPHLDFSCTACDYASTSLSLHGRRYYEVDKEFFHADYQIGWCFVCKSLSLIELMPEQTMLQQKQLEVAELRKKLEKMEKRPKSELTWLQKLMGHKEKNEEVGEKFDPFVSRKLEGLEKEIANSTVLQKIFKNRKSPIRCLNCGGDKHLYLNTDGWGRFYELTKPEPMGFKHPFCGGELLARCSEARFHMKLKKSIYDLDGRKIGEVVDF